MNIPGLAAEQLQTVRNCIPANADLKLFGSRVVGNFRPNSDLDIAIMSGLPKAEIAQFIRKLDASGLPFTADVYTYNDCGTDFKKLIDDTGVRFE